MNQPAARPISAAHPIVIEPSATRVIVRAGGEVLADSGRALKLREAQYPAVIYIPRADVNMALFEKSAHQTYCPYKGNASYYSLRTEQSSVANAAWSYETPYEQVGSIAGHLAFYPDRVDAIQEG